MFKPGGKAEIIRSQQKDDFYINYLHGLTADVIHSFFGPRVWIAWRKEIDLLADLGYFVLTTVSGFQTIGEEYVNIVQVDQTRKQVPSALRRGVMVLLHVLGPYCIRRFLEWLEKKLRSPDSQEIPIETRECLLKCIPIAKTCVLYVHRLHMAVFYLRGIYYQLAKRMNRVQYLQYTGGRQQVDDVVASSFRVLGWVTLTQLVGSGLLGAYRYFREKSKRSSSSSTIEEESTSAYVSADRKCSLCLEERKHSSVTPCGHLFCWNCIHDWCCSKPECPLCREKFEPHRIVYLQNIDPV